MGNKIEYYQEITLDLREKWELKIAYTNTDKVLSAELELKDYLEGRESNILCLVEVKLFRDEKLFNVGKSKFRVEKRWEEKNNGAGEEYTKTSIGYFKFSRAARNY